MPKNIFFDLDHTIWDFNANADDTLRELYDLYDIYALTGKSVDAFIEIYIRINNENWALYRQNKINKATLRTIRFENTFREMGVPEDKIPVDIWETYLNICPTKTKLLPGARETLDYLTGKYELHLITNGFAETQRRKLHHSDLGKYFNSLTISEEVGVQKPHPLIFKTALENAGSSQKTSHYIGDNFEADIKGAIGSGWKAYWICDDWNNFSHEDCRIILDLRDLKKYF